MAGGGTGTPVWFQCSKCRRSKGRWPYGSPEHADASRRGTFTRIRLTGRSRPNRSTNRWARVSGTVREYECLDCGHTGWSNHADLERLARREDPRLPEERTP